MTVTTGAAGLIVVLIVVGGLLVGLIGFIVTAMREGAASEEARDDLDPSLSSSPETDAMG